MKSKLRRFFTNNVWLKILSLAAGVVIWVLLSSTQDPVQSVRVNVPIAYQNGDLLLGNEKLIMLSGPETISVTVSVRRSKQSKISQDMFRCTADLTDHSGGDLMNQRVHVQLNQSSGFDSILDWSFTKNDPNVIVAMDNYITKSFLVEILPEDSLTEGLILEDSVTFDPAYVTVSGPETKFSSLASVKAIVNLQELSADGGGIFSKDVHVKMFDANENEIINADGAIHMSNQAVVMNATVSRIGTLAVKLDGVSGTPAGGYKYLSGTVEPEIISVYGLKSLIANLTEIRIPGEVVNIEGISEDKVFNVDITPYLPDGVTLADNNGFVTVKVQVEKLVSKTLSVPAANIQIKGKQKMLEYRINTENVNLKVSGFKEDLDLLTSASVVLTADVSELKAGINRVKVDVGELNGYTIENADNVYVYVSVTEITEEESESETEEETESDTENSSGSESEPTEESSSPQDETETEADSNENE